MEAYEIRVLLTTNMNFGTDFLNISLNRFVVFGVSGALFGTWMVYDLGTPEKDAEGNIIEDEFSKLPTVQQYVRRMWKSLTYYQKVSFCFV